MRNELKNEIISKLNPNYNWGKCCNEIQEIALKLLNKKDKEIYLKKTFRDSNMCEGMDCVIFSGKVFDWRTFNNRRNDIIFAFLDYFDNKTLEQIKEKLS